MKVVFIEPASIELDDAIAYYDIQMKGLGDQFLDDVLKSINILSRFPKSGTHCTENTEKIRLSKFPYTIIYSMDIQIITILAVSHQHRKPEYWIDRTKGEIDSE